MVPVANANLHKISFLTLCERKIQCLRLKYYNFDDYEQLSTSIKIKLRLVAL